MLTKDQLSIAIAAVLVSAVLLGWLLRWLWVRMGPRTVTDDERFKEMMAGLHDAEHALNLAEEERQLAENLLAAREAEMEERMSQVDQSIAAREADLQTALREAQAESEAVMSGLRTARAQIRALELELEEIRGRKS